MTLQAIFSMNFVDFGGNSELGQGGLKMSPYWWLYPATAVPLTALVVVIWMLWRRRRLERKSKRLPDIESMYAASLGSVGSGFPGR
jgi:hypothetical protein